METLQKLYKVIESRKNSPEPDSYTCYLFEKGTDKILKKCAEECGEVLIAAKNKNNKDTSEEICDLLYHLMVLMVQENIPLTDVLDILEQRSQKIGNFKGITDSNHMS